MTITTNSIRPRPMAAPAPTRSTQPAAKKESAPTNKKMEGDRLEFSWLDRNSNNRVTSREFGPGNRRQEQFRRYDADQNGKLTLEEFLTGREADRAAKKKKDEPAAPETEIAYTTKNPYSDIDQLATDLGTDGQTLREMNGWGPETNSVPAGTPVALPDTPEVREKVTQYQGGQPPVTQEAGTGAATVAPVSPSDPATAGGNVPQIYQLNPAGAENGYHNGPSNCGPTSMAMVARSFGLHPEMTDAQLINFLGDGVGTNANGTPHQGILDMAANLGLPATQAGLGGDAAWIKAQLEAGKKVIVNGNFGLGGHYVTVTGVDANGNFLVNDPYEGPRVITPAEMEGYQNANTHEGQVIGTAFAIG